MAMFCLNMLGENPKTQLEITQNSQNTNTDPFAKIRQNNGIDPETEGSTEIIN